MNSKIASSTSQRVALFGKIFTSNLKSKWAEVLIYEKDTIIYVGDKAGSEQYLNEFTQKIELNEDHLILPGFIDTHIHYILGGLQVISNQIKECDSLEAFHKQLKEFVTKEKDSEWIFAYDYMDIMFPDNKPHKKYLDEICPDKPIALMRYDNHTYLVNTKALEIANITKETPDPPRGLVEKDKEGNPTGCLHERAMDLVSEYFPKRKPEEYTNALHASADIFLKEGITSCTDAMVITRHCQHFQEIYSQQSDQLPRASLSILWNEELEEKINTWKGDKFTLYELLGIPERDKLKVNTVKFLVDGVLESKTAALEEPYIGKDENDFGIKNFEEDQLNEHVAKLHANGIQAHFHAIGDRAVRMALDAVEYAKKKAGENTNIKDPRHYIAHNQIVKERDYKRFKELGVHTSFSPVWFCTDSESEEVDKLLGFPRARLQYPIKDLMNAGTVVTFGADWPVTSPRPVDGIETAVTRKLLGNANKDAEPWCPDQCLTVEEAVIIYTINSAYVGHREDITGSLEAGKKADIVVLDKDIFKCDPSTIHETQVRLTIVDGKVLHNTLKGIEIK